MFRVSATIECSLKTRIDLRVGVETTERDAEQPITYDNGAKTEYCGQACLAFACVAHAYGYNVARLV